MDVTWQFTRNDVAALRGAVAKYREHTIVRDRIARNLAASKPAVTRERFWKALPMRY
jgi:hypothetical protein